MRTLAFDLDDTLYDELHYVEAGFRTVAQAFASELGVTANQLEQDFLQHLREHGRQRVFDDTLAKHGVVADPALIARMVECYRHQQPSLSLYPGVRGMLERLALDFRLVLVTDGLPLMQKNKVQGLGVADCFERIVYCWEHDTPKPDSRGYVLAIGETDADGAVIVGDHPVNDGEPARVLGLPFVRVKSRRFAELPGGDIVIASVTELPGVLNDV